MRTDIESIERAIVDVLADQGGVGRDDRIIDRVWDRLGNCHRQPDYGFRCKVRHCADRLSLRGRLRIRVRELEWWQLIGA